MFRRVQNVSQQVSNHLDQIYLNKPPLGNAVYLLMSYNYHWIYTQSQIIFASSVTELLYIEEITALPPNRHHFCHLLHIKLPLSFFNGLDVASSRTNQIMKLTLPFKYYNTIRKHCYYCLTYILVVILFIVNSNTISTDTHAVSVIILIGIHLN